MVNRHFSPYQLVHLMKLRTNPLDCLLICDGVGVGKTISAAYILFHQSRIEKQPSIIICPPILVDKWRFELKHRFGLETRTALDKTGFELMIEEIGSCKEWDEGPIYVVPLSYLSRSEITKMESFGLIVIDEVHATRNPMTKVHQNCRKIAMRAKYRVGLSATPINNSLSDLAAILCILIPNATFTQMVQMINDLWGTEVMKSISSITTRFQKEQVSEEFTKRNVHTEVIHYPDHYDEIVHSLVNERAFMTGSQSHLETIVYFRLASSSPMAFQRNFRASDYDFSFPDPKVEHLQELLDSKPNERWLIFTEFKETAKHIQDKIDNRLSLIISGDLDAETRGAYVNIFRDDPTCVTIMTPVGSEGLDFQFCSNLVNYDLHWNPMKIEQRIGRIDRIGQEKESVNIHNFVARGSIDEKVLQVIGGKLALVSDSFADIMPIIESSTSAILYDLEALHVEMNQAENLIKAAEFYNQFIGVDLDVLPELVPDFCRVENWRPGNWNPVPWFASCDAWEKVHKKDSNQFMELIVAYSSDS